MANLSEARVKHCGVHPPYEWLDTERTVAYARRHALAPILNDLYGRVQDAFGDACRGQILALDHDDDHLILYVQWTGDVDGYMRAHDRFDDWWLEQMDRTAGRISVNVIFCAFD